jgi:hypothetical protein
MYANTMKSRAVSWIIAHANDGKEHKISDIGYQCRANPMAVRNAIKHLVENGEITAEKTGPLRLSRWQFTRR